MPRIRSLATIVSVLALAAGCSTTSGTAAPPAGSRASQAPASVAPVASAAAATKAQSSATPSATSASAPPVASASGLIVFASGRDNKNGDQVYVMAPDGSQKPTILTKDFGGGWMPALSPDRTKVAFTTSRVSDAGVGNIYVMNLDGSGLLRISNRDCCSLRASWSPDGKRILYEGPQATSS